MSKQVEVEVDGRRLRLSNLDKVLYPATGFTKGEVIDYYTRIAPTVLPHLRNRPLTLKRYPDGVEAEHFYEKQAPRHAPEWVETARIPSGHTRPFIDFVLANDRATLVWLANLADLELHTSLSKASDVDTPTMVAFDLDPGAPAALLECAQVALLLRDMLDDLGLRCFAKTSGSKGIHLAVPLNVKASYERTKPFAQALAQLLEKRHPDRVVSKMTKKLREGKVLIDWSQNDAHKTTVCAYSLRARERPTVSAPLAWDEVEAASVAGDAGRLVFESHDVLERVERHGDLFAPVAEVEQKLPKLPTA
ncbi:MAG: non-homologous end-joining DNA ligase [Solirubrobacterales bacterium]